MTRTGARRSYRNREEVKSQEQGRGEITGHSVLQL